MIRPSRANTASSSRASDGTFRIIQKANWPDIVRRLLAYTSFIVGKYRVPSAESARDLSDYVEEAVILVLEGKTGQRQNTGESLFTILAATIGMLVRRDKQITPAAAPVSDNHSPVIQLASPTDLMLYLAARPEAIRNIPPRRFEEVMAEIFADFGYSVELTRAARDDGIDIIAIGRSMPLGADEKYLIQCKRYARDNHVGVSVVRELLGVGVRWPSTGMIVATTSTFTTPAKEFASSETTRWRLHLRDYQDITGWLQAYACRRGM